MYLYINTNQVLVKDVVKHFPEKFKVFDLPVSPRLLELFSGTGRKDLQAFHTKLKKNPDAFSIRKLKTVTSTYHAAHKEELRLKSKITKKNEV